MAAKRICRSLLLSVTLAFTVPLLSRQAKPHASPKPMTTPVAKPAEHEGGGKH
jgi:hypothetical protein